MIFPDRFPFDVLDPQPDHCPNCGCDHTIAERDAECEHPDCDCHQELGPNGLRYRWGDR